MIREDNEIVHKIYKDNTSGICLDTCTAADTYALWRVYQDILYPWLTTYPTEPDTMTFEDKWVLMHMPPANNYLVEHINIIQRYHKEVAEGGYFTLKDMYNWMVTNKMFAHNNDIVTTI